MKKENTNIRLSQTDDTLYAFVSGEVDHHTAKGIRQAIDAALISYAPECLVMDVSGITFMDSSGLGLVLGRYTKACEAGIAFSVQGAGERVIRMFDMAGLDRIIDYKEKKTDEKNL